MNFFSWLICCLATLIAAVLLLAVFSEVAFSAQTIERKIDGKQILLNTAPCEKGHKAYLIETDVVKSGCWYNDGKDVVTEFESVITKYSKKLFEDIAGMKE